MRLVQASAGFQGTELQHNGGENDHASRSALSTLSGFGCS
ncbi:hypothetical protein SynMITS9220_02042 [Synechococcus sp. MIT S9220]|nr:hypothetical protein SynMITS9220_02042 [Synechococcus sp. MIT S9220]